jgi:hypothetical protein
VTHARVGDVMTTDVITVARTTPGKEIAAGLRESRVTAFPVLGEEGNVAGVVSAADLLAKVSHEDAGERPRHPRRAWKREAPGGERLPFGYGRFPRRDQAYAWWSGSPSPKMCAAYAAACVRRSMPSFWNRADT